MDGISAIRDCFVTKCHKHVLLDRCGVVCRPLPPISKLQRGYTVRELHKAHTSPSSPADQFSVWSARNSCNSASKVSRSCALSEVRWPDLRRWIFSPVRIAGRDKLRYQVNRKSSLPHRCAYTANFVAAYTYAVRSKSTETHFQLRGMGDISILLMDVKGDY